MGFVTKIKQYSTTILTISFALLAFLISISFVLFAKIEEFINPNISLDSIEDTIIDETRYITH